MKISDLYQWKLEFVNFSFKDSNYCQCEGFVNCSLVNYKYDPKYNTQFDLNERNKILFSKPVAVGRKTHYSRYLNPLKIERPKVEKRSNKVMKDLASKFFYDPFETSISK